MAHEHRAQGDDISFPLQKIENRYMEKEVRQAFLEYSMSVITSRALSGGLIPFVNC